MGKAALLAAIVVRAGSSSDLPATRLASAGVRAKHTFADAGRRLPQEMPPDVAAARKLVIPQAPWLLPSSWLPLRTRGYDVISATGERVTLACVNWYGAHMRQLVNNGLNARPLPEIAALIVDLRFNCVRLPFSLDMASGKSPFNIVPHASKVLAKNPSLQHLSPLQVFDAVVRELTKVGLLVILNDHVSSGGWCCGDADGEGLWYTEQYPESAWLDALGNLSARYRNDSRVVGFDIRNEIRSSEMGVPTWGSKDPDTDWAMAAAKGGVRVLSSNPDMLVIVSGLSYSMFLCDIPQHPLHLDPALIGHLVYTAHDYSWYSSDLSVQHRIGARHCQVYLIVLIASWTLMPLILTLWSLVKNVGIVMMCFSALRSVKIARCGASRFRWCVRAPLLACQYSFLLEITIAAVLTVLFLYALGLTTLHLNGCVDSGIVGGVQAELLMGPPFLLSLLMWLRLQTSAVLEVANMPSVRQFRFGQDTLNTSLRCCPAAMVPQDNQDNENADVEMAEMPGSGVCVADKDDEDIEKTVKTPMLKRFCPCRVPRPLMLAAIVWTVTACVFAVVLIAYNRLESYDTFAHELDSRWGFLMRTKSLETDTVISTVNASGIAPVWLGEFGTDTESSWWRYMVRYLREKPIAGWAYWPLNGEKRPNQPETYGVLLEDMRTIRDGWRLRDLQDLALSHMAFNTSMSMSASGVH
eukprot:TRINITY_DN30181_c0_g1_i1.p1 TRINITY_DN30181_c0_g1~~TRINITY_DN30181_c0_g1_i1.p1  ORF type:complete len:726 (-),score=50.92 TRINITY_DN30181_c0_g1_i1:133-2220(-)